MTERKQTLNVAMIGHGFIGRVHSNAFHQVCHFFEIPFKLHLKVVCGRDRTKLDAMASQWGWEGTETDWRALVSRSELQIVDIATPHVLHPSIVMAVCPAG